MFCIYSIYSIVSHHLKPETSFHIDTESHKNNNNNNNNNITNKTNACKCN